MTAKAQKKDEPVNPMLDLKAIRLAPRMATAMRAHVEQLRYHLGCIERAIPEVRIQANQNHVQPIVTSTKAIDLQMQELERVLSEWDLL